MVVFKGFLTGFVTISCVTTMFTIASSPCSLLLPVEVMSVRSSDASTPLGPVETARYTREMLESLRQIAMEQKQELLAHLLALAVLEARLQEGQETLLPG